MSKTEVLPNNVALIDLAGRINTEHEVCPATGRTKPAQKRATELPQEFRHTDHNQAFVSFTVS